MHVHGHLTDGNVAKQPTKTCCLFNLIFILMQTDHLSASLGGCCKMRLFSIAQRKSNFFTVIFCPLQPKVWSVLFTLCLHKMSTIWEQGSWLLLIAHVHLMWNGPIFNVTFSTTQPRNSGWAPVSRDCSLWSVSSCLHLLIVKHLSSMSASRPGQGLN